MSKEKRKLVQVRPVDPRRHFQIAMVLASLTAGLLVMFNCDRSMNRTSAKELGYNASQHGWPLIYLERVFEEKLPNHVRHTRSYDWPYPAVKGEARSWIVGNLLFDIVACMLIVTIIYWFVRAVVLRFDAERKKLPVVGSEALIDQDG